MNDRAEPPRTSPPARPTGWRAVALGAALLAVLLLGLVFSLRGQAEAQGRAAQRRVADAERLAEASTAEAALAAWRAGDISRALALSAKAPAHPLAVGLSLLARERGAAERLWAVKTEAGCAAVAWAGEVALCATLNGVACFGAGGAPESVLSPGPAAGWQHALAVLPDGTVAFGGDDRTLRVWDVAARRELRQVGGFASGLRALAVEGAALVVGLASGEVLRVAPDGTVTPVATLPRAVSALAVSQGALAMASEGLLRVEAATPFALERHVGALAFGVGHRLVLGVEREVVTLEGVEARRPSAGHTDEVTAVAVAPGRVVSGSGDGTVRWWFDDGGAEGVLGGFEAGVQALALSGGGVALVASRARGLEAVRLPARRAAPEADGVPSAHGWWPGSGLVSGYRDGRVRRLDEETGARVTLEARHVAPVRALAPVPLAPQAGGLRFLSAGDDGRVLAQRWNGEVEPLDVVVGARVVALATSPDGARAAWAADDGTRVLWSLEYQREIHRARDAVVHALAFSPDGRTLAAGRADQRIELLDAQTGAPRGLLEPLDAAVSALAWAPSGEALVSGGADGRVTVWDVAGRRVRASWREGRERVGSLDVRGDGALLAAGSDDGAVYLWDLRAGRLVAQVPADEGDALLVAFTEAGLLSVGVDRVVHRWALPALEEHPSGR